MKRLLVLMGLGFVGLCWAEGVSFTQLLGVAFDTPDAKVDQPMTLTSECNAQTFTTTLEKPNTKTPTFTVVMKLVDVKELANLKVSHTLDYTTASGQKKELKAVQRILPVPYASHAKYIERTMDTGEGTTTDFTVKNTLTVKGNLDVTTGIEGPSTNTPTNTTEPLETVTTETLSGVDNLVVALDEGEVNDGTQQVTMAGLTAQNVTVESPITLPWGNMEGVGTVPIDTIIAWYSDRSPNEFINASASKSAIPAGQGWVYCDGTHGTPDLRGRFLAGAGGDYNLETREGAEKVALTKDNLPEHTHTVKVRMPGRLKK